MDKEEREKGGEKIDRDGKGACDREKGGECKVKERQRERIGEKEVSKKDRWRKRKGNNKEEGGVEENCVAKEKDVEGCLKERKGRDGIENIGWKKR